MDLTPAAKRAFQIQSCGPAPSIDGVEIVELKRLSDDGGSMTELARLADGHPQAFAGFVVRQINYSEVEPGAIKEFHLHQRQTDVWYVPPSARMLMVLLDVRQGGKPEGGRMRFTLAPGTSLLVLTQPAAEHDPRCALVQGDICDATLVRDVMRGVDAAVNFAAESHVDRSLMEPDAFLKTDVFGVFTLLEAVKELKIPRFVHISTDEVYGSVEHGSSRESDPVRPSNPYSASKAGGDLLALAHRHTPPGPVLITRPAHNLRA